MTKDKRYPNLNIMIEESRKRLEDMISRHGSVDHAEILQVSQQLDELIILFYKDKEKAKDKI